MTIAEQTYSLLRDNYITGFERLFISDVRVGSYLTAVRLSDGSMGTASTLDEDHAYCSKEDREFGEFTPSKIKGRKLIDLFLLPEKRALIRSLKSASLNALSSAIISSGKYHIVENSDPIELVDLGSRKTITVVGAFQSYITKIAETDNKLFVLELNEKALRPGQKRFFVPAERFNEVIPSSDVVIITGQTLVNRTIDELLSAVTPGSEVIVTGPSGSILPDVLFSHNVSIIGASVITNPDMVFDIVGEGGLGYHLFRYCARKISILKEHES